jgi:PAS domain S-box-containing protein
MFMKQRTQIASWLGRILGLALVYAGSGWLGMQFLHYLGNFTLIWLPSGFAVAALWRWGLNLWPAIFLASLVIGAWPLSVSSGMANALGAVVCTHLLRRWKFDPRLRDFRDLRALLLAATGGMLLAATFGSVFKHLYGHPEGIRLWLGWWQSDTTGVVLLTPLLLSGGRESWATIRTRCREFSLWCILTLSLGGMLLWNDHLPLAFLAMVPLGWGAMRFGRLGAALGAFLIGMAAILSGALGVGQLTVADPDHALLVISCYLMAVLFLSWLIYSFQCHRDRQEAELRLSEARYRRAERATQDGLWERDLGSDVEYRSPRWLEILGYGPQDLASNYEAISDLLHPDDRARALTIKETCERDGKPGAMECRMRRKDGDYVWVMSRAWVETDATGKPIRMTGAITDITARRKTEAELLESELLNRALISAIPDTIFINKRDGEYLSAHMPDPGILLVPPEKFIGRRVSEVLPQPLADQLLKSLNDALDSGKVQELTYSLTIHGEEKHFEGRVAPRTEETAITIVRDITERRKTAAERENLAAQNRQLQKSEGLTRMAEAIAHHFNNQLQAVMGNLEIALLQCPSHVPTVKSMNEALKAAVKAAEMSRLMLTYLGKDFSVRDSLDLAEYSRQSLALVRRIMPPGVHLQAMLPSPGPIIRANPKQVHQVLVNLVTNAWEATGQSGNVIHVTTKTVSPEEISAANRFPVDWQPAESAYACLEVTDTGEGIAPQHIEKLFDPFYTTKFIGRGLGLSVILGSIRAQKGGIVVRSELGQGSVFQVFFPLAPGPAAPSITSTDRALHQVTTGTVLVVEDDSGVRDFARRVLAEAGFTVLVAADGLEALEVFRQRQAEIECVLCDVTMSGMNGWETLHALRGLAPGIPVVLSSGHGEAHVMQVRNAEQPQGFLHKPYKIQALIDTLGQILREARESPMD